MQLAFLLLHTLLFHNESFISPVYFFFFLNSLRFLFALLSRRTLAWFFRHVISKNTCRRFGFWYFHTVVGCTSRVVTCSKNQRIIWESERKKWTMQAGVVDWIFRTHYQTREKKVTCVVDKNDENRAATFVTTLCKVDIDVWREWHYNSRYDLKERTTKTYQDRKYDHPAGITDKFAHYFASVYAPQDPNHCASPDHVGKGETIRLDQITTSQVE